MQLVDAPVRAPGVCAITSKGGSLIDTGRAVVHWGHAYLDPELIREAAALLGLVDDREHDRLVAQLAEANARIEELENGEDSILVKYDGLRACMAETMQHGFVVDRKGTIRFRPASGSRIMKD